MKKRIKLVVPAGLKPYPFQRADIRYYTKKLLRRGGAYCMNEQGTGKTIISTIVANILRRKGKVKRLLIVAPAIMRPTWAEEFQLWSKYDWNIHAIDKDTPYDTFKRRLPNADADCVIVSYRYLIDKRVMKAFLKRYQFDMMIADEWHYCKSLKNKRTRMGVLCMLRAKYSLALSGTPYTKNVMDLYSQFLPFASEEELGSSFTEFGYKFSTLVDNGFGRYFEGLRNEDELISIYRKFSRRRLLEDVVDQLPGISYRNIYVDVPKSIAKKSLRFVDKAVADVMGETYEYRDTEEKDFVATMRRELGVAKCKGIVEHILYTLESQDHLVVFCYHTQVIKILEESLRKKKIKTASLYGKTAAKEKQQVIKKFQKGLIPVLLLQIRSAIGITLTKSSYGIAAELDWSHAAMDQAFKRLHRISQDNHVQIDHVIARNSVDKPIVGAIYKKRAEARRIMGD